MIYNSTFNNIALGSDFGFLTITEGDLGGCTGFPLLTLEAQAYSQRRCRNISSGDPEFCLHWHHNLSQLGSHIHSSLFPSSSCQPANSKSLQ